MRYLKIFLITIVTVSVMLLIDDDVDAAETDLVYPESLHGMELGDEVTVTATITLEPDDYQHYDIAENWFGFGPGTEMVPSTFSGGVTSASHTFTVSNSTFSSCITSTGKLEIAFAAEGIDESAGRGTELSRSSRPIPCSVLVSPNLDAIQRDAVCGSDNDNILGLNSQPSGVTVDPGTWINNQRTVTLTADTGYSFTKGTLSNEITLAFTDSGPCETDPPIPPVHTKVCGVDNDVVTLDANQPENVIVTNDGEWINGSWNITFMAEENYKLPDGTKAEYNLTDSGPCVTDSPIPPVVTEVCGPDNDVVLLEANQPANVIVESDGDWTEGEWNITFSAAEDYALPDDARAVYKLVDTAEPCPTDAPVPPVQTAICGPDNDLVTIPPQPDGVTLESDTDWEDNRRTITFAVAPNFITEGETTFTLTDADEACTKAVTVVLETSDGGSIAGANYALYAPTASQPGQSAFEEGVVGADNMIVFEELIAGQYRLTVDAKGYEPVDEMFVVNDGEEAQEFVFQVKALQVEPTAAPVSALPSTGTGSPDGSLVAGLAMMIAAMLATVAFVGRSQRT